MGHPAGGAGSRRDSALAPGSEHLRALMARLDAVVRLAETTARAIGELTAEAENALTDRVPHRDPLVIAAPPDRSEAEDLDVVQLIEDDEALEMAELIEGSETLAPTEPIESDEAPDVADLEAQRILSAARARALRIEREAHRRAEELIEEARRRGSARTHPGFRRGWTRLPARASLHSRAGPSSGHGQPAADPPSELPPVAADGGSSRS